jgi:adenine deaminase
MSDLSQFIHGLPKAELHLHIEGSLEPEQMFEFGRRNGVALPFRSVEAVRAAYAFANLQDFLDIYYQGARVLVTEADFHDLALAYFRRVAADGCRHVELFFDPQTHTDRGLPFAVAADGLLSGMAEAERSLGITSGLILCFLRHLDEDTAFETPMRRPASADSSSWPMPERRAPRPMSGKRSIFCTWTVSTMATGRSRIRRWSAAWPPKT